MEENRNLLGPILKKQNQTSPNWVVLNNLKEKLR